MIRYAHEWQTALEKSFPKRSFVCIVVDIQGQFVFVSRYVKKLAPPEGVNKAEGDMNQYVSSSMDNHKFGSFLPFVTYGYMGAYYLQPSRIRAIIVHVDLLCNDTQFSLFFNCWVHNSLGIQRRKIYRYFELHAKVVSFYIIGL